MTAVLRPSPLRRNSSVCESLPAVPEHQVAETHSSWDSEDEDDDEEEGSGESAEAERTATTSYSDVDPSMEFMDKLAKSVDGLMAAQEKGNTMLDTLIKLNEDQLTLAHERTRAMRHAAVLAAKVSG